MEKKKSKFSKLRLPTSSSNINKSDKFVSSQLSRYFHQNGATSSSSSHTNESATVETEINVNQSESSRELRSKSKIENIGVTKPTKKLLLSEKLDKTAEKIKAIKKRKKGNSESSIKKFLHINDSLDQNDFETPKKLKLVPKKKAKVRSNKNQTDIRNIVKKTQKSDEEILYNAITAQSAIENFDANQLIYSLTLSRSIIETNQSQNEFKSNDEPTNSIKSTQDRMAEIQHTLEKYGFRGKHGYSEEGFNNIPKVDFKSRKKYKKRKKYDEFHHKPLPEKVEILLKNEYEYELLNEGSVGNYDILSEFLLDFHNEEKCLFKLQSNENCLNINSYYTGGLFKPSTLKSGHLLKNWSNIPGRDKSPLKLTEVEIPSDETDIKNNEDGNELLTECAVFSTPPKIDKEINIGSPDLFAFSDSDNDEERHVIQIVSSTEYSESYENGMNLIDNIQDNKESKEITYTVDSNLSDEIQIVDLTKDTEYPETKNDVYLSQLEPLENAVLSVSSTESFVLEIPENSTIQRALSSPQISFILDKSDAESHGIIQLSTSVLKSWDPETERALLSPQLSTEESDGELSVQSISTLKSYKAPTKSLIKNVSFGSNIDLSQKSETTEVWEILDEEINYSIHHSALENINVTPKFSNELCDNSSNSTILVDNNYEYFSNVSSNNLSFNESVLITNEEDLLEESLVDKTDEVNNINVLNDSINDILFQSNNKLSNDNERKGNSFMHKSKELRKYDSEPLLLKETSIKQNLNLLHIEESSEDEFDKLVVGNSKIVDLVQTHSNNDKCESEYFEISSDDNDSTIINESFHHFINTINKENKEVEKIPCSNENFKVSSNWDDHEIINSKISNNTELNQSKTYPHDQYIYKTRNVSPKPDYRNMKLDLLHDELKKFGIKRLSQRKSVLILEHIYNQTHPRIELSDDEDSTDLNVSLSQPTTSISNLEIKYGLAKGYSKKIHEREKCEITAIKGSSNCIDFNYVDKNINLIEEDGFTGDLLKDEKYILHSKPRRKIHSCSLPLQIAFNNLLRANSKLKTAILSFEPIELDKLYLFFKENGFKYETNDLIAFLDRRCITFHTTRNTKK